MASLYCNVLLLKSVEGLLTLKNGWHARLEGWSLKGRTEQGTHSMMKYSEECVMSTQAAKFKLCLFQATWPGWMRVLRRLKLLRVWLSSSASSVEKHPQEGTQWPITLRHCIIRAATNAATVHSFSLPEIIEMCTSAESTNTHEEV